MPSSGQTAIDMALNSGYKELASKLAYWAVLASRSKVLSRSLKFSCGFLTFLFR